MSSPRFIARRFWRLISPILVVGGLMSAFILMPGVVGAALKTSHPAIPATGETLNSYQAQGPNNGTNPVIYNGGAVITSPQAFLIFEGSYWGQTYRSGPQTNMQRVQQYFNDVSGSAFEGILTQYYYTDAGGTHHPISNTISVAGAVLDTNLSYSNHCQGTNLLYDPGTTASPNDITDEITKESNANNWTNTASSIFFVFTPPDYSLALGSCSGSGNPPNNLQCAYHTTLVGYNYAAMNWGNNIVNCSTDGNITDTLINEASHEQFEAITDPQTVMYTYGTGWNNSDCNDSTFFPWCEIGDKCQNQHPGIYLNGTFYDGVQGEFSNATGECEYTPKPPAPTPTPTHTPATTNTACSTSPSYSHCDGYDPPGSHCSASYGAYNVGRYPGDYTWLQIWYDSTCKSNYILVNWPSPAPSCGTNITCNAIAEVDFARTTPGHTGQWCNASSDNGNVCAQAANMECTSPGQCPQGTLLYYCAKLSAYCDTAFGVSFNGEYIGTTSGWQSFYTDLLYAPSQAVQACVRFFNTNYPDSLTNLTCSQWH